MKYGVRKPNIKKSIKARTTGKMKRQVKKAVNPLYGKKGMGVINNPKRLHITPYITERLSAYLIYQKVSRPQIRRVLSETPLP